MAWALLCPAQLSQATCSEISQAGLALPHPAGWINTGFGLDKEQALLHQLHSSSRSILQALPLSAGLGQEQLTHQAQTAQAACSSP